MKHQKNKEQVYMQTKQQQMNRQELLREQKKQTWVNNVLQVKQVQKKSPIKTNMQQNRRNKIMKSTRDDYLCKL